jgi:glycosyl transferase, family 25
MKAYYINLDRAIERRAHMEDQAQKAGLDFIRIAAVDGRDLDSAEVRQICPAAGLSHLLSAVEVACFLSHRLAWKAISEGTEPYGVVFEDDIKLSNAAGNYLRDGSWIPSGCQLIKVETIARLLWLAPPAFNLHGNRRLWRMASANMGGGGYIVSKSLAATLLDLTKTFADPVDVVLFHPDSPLWKQYQAFQMDPALCIQQVRTKQVFMDDTAAASQMDGVRGTVKKSFPSKLAREILRPFIQMAEYLWYSARARAGGGCYKKVEML